MNNLNRIRSNTVGKSGTGVQKSGTGNRFSRRLVSTAAALAIILPFSLSAEPTQPFLMDVHEGVVHLTLHDQGRVISGQALLADNQASFVRIHMHQLVMPRDSERTASQGSGSGGLMTHSSGSGGQSVGTCGGGLMTHSSGSGGQSVNPSAGGLMTHSSGSGGQSVGACGGGLMTHSSGSGGQSVNPTAGSLMTHSSGSGGQSVGTCKSKMAPWGFADVMVGSGELNVIVYRLGQSGGPREHIMAAAEFDQQGKLANRWTAEP